MFERNVDFAREKFHQCHISQEETGDDSEQRSAPPGFPDRFEPQAPDEREREILYTRVREGRPDYL